MPMRVPRYVRLTIFCVVVLGIIIGAVFGVRAIVTGGHKISDEGVRAQAALSENVVAFGDGYLVSDGIRLRCYGQNEKLRWEYAPDAQEQEYAASAKLVALWRAENLHLLDDGGRVLFKVPLSGPIQMARCGVSAVAAYIPDAGIIEVLSKDGGKSLDTIEVTQTVLDFGFYSDQDLVWVLTLSTEGSVPSTNLSRYQPGKTLAGGTPFEDQVVYAVRYLDGKIFAVGTHEVSILTNTETLPARPLVIGWQLIDDQELSKTDLGLLFTLSGEAAAGAPERLKLVRADGSSQEMHLPPGCIAAFVGEKGIWGIAPQTIHVLSFDGAATEYALSYTIAAVGPKLSQGRLMVQVGEETRVIKLP